MKRSSVRAIRGHAPVAGRRGIGGRWRAAICVVAVVGALLVSVHARAGRRGQFALRERRRPVALALRDALRAEGRAQERDHDAIARPVPEPRRDAEPPRRGAARVHRGGAREPPDPVPADAARRLRALRRPGVPRGRAGARGPVPLRQDLQRPGDRRSRRDDPLRPRPDRLPRPGPVAERRLVHRPRVPPRPERLPQLLQARRREHPRPGARERRRRRRAVVRHRRRHGPFGGRRALRRHRAPHVPARRGGRRRVLDVPGRHGSPRAQRHRHRDQPDHGGLRARAGRPPAARRQQRQPDLPQRRDRPLQQQQPVPAADARTRPTSTP